MEFRIADTFTDSLARLTGDEQKAVEISRLLTGRTDEEIDSLGAVRINIGEDTVAFQRIPTAV
jgi:hypothetical protein